MLRCVVEHAPKIVGKRGRCRQGQIGGERAPSSPVRRHPRYVRKACRGTSARSSRSRPSRALSGLARFLEPWGRRRRPPPSCEKCCGGTGRGGRRGRPAPRATGARGPIAPAPLPECSGQMSRGYSRRWRPTGGTRSPTFPSGNRPASEGRRTSSGGCHGGSRCPMLAPLGRRNVTSVRKCPVVVRLRTACAAGWRRKACLRRDSRVRRPRARRGRGG